MPDFLGMLFPLIVIVLIGRVLGSAMQKQKAKQGSSPAQPVRGSTGPQPGMRPAASPTVLGNPVRSVTPASPFAAPRPKPAAAPARTAPRPAPQTAAAAAGTGEAPKADAPLTVLRPTRVSSKKPVSISVPLTASALQQAVVMKEILERPRHRTGGRIR